MKLGAWKWEYNIFNLPCDYKIQRSCEKFGESKVW